MRFSLITLIAEDGTSHLLNLIKGINWSTQKPSEILLVSMGRPLKIKVFNCDIPIYNIPCEMGDPNALPYAAARNMAVAWPRRKT